MLRPKRAYGDCQLDQLCSARGRRSWQVTWFLSFSFWWIGCFLNDISWDMKAWLYSVPAPKNNQPEHLSTIFILKTMVCRLGLLLTLLLMTINLNNSATESIPPSGLCPIRRLTSNIPRIGLVRTDNKTIHLLRRNLPSHSLDPDKHCLHPRCALRVLPHPPPPTLWQ